MKYFLSFITTVLCSLTLFAQTDIDQARAALEQGKYDDAITTIQKILSSDSRNVEAHYYLGEAYRLKGDLGNAQKELENTLDYDDEYEPAIVSMIKVYGKEKEWDKAQDMFDQAAKYHKKSTLAPLALAQSYLESDSLDKAAVYFSKVKELDENNIDAYVGLSEVYARQNVIVLAVMNLETATKIDSTNPGLWYKLATAILKNRSLNAMQIREVTDALQKSIDLDSTNYRAIFDAANIFYRIDRPEFYRRAAEFFKKYVALKKDNPEAWEKYGISAYKANAFTDAIPALEQAISMGVKNYELKPMLANSYYYTKEYQKAIDAFNGFPADSLGRDEYYKMGVSAFKLDDTSKAIAYYEKANAQDTVTNIAAGDLAYIYVGQRNYPRALAEYQKLLEKDPDNLVALFYAGYSSYVLEQYAPAEKYFAKFVALKPTNIQGRNLLAQVLIQLDKREEATKECNAIISLADSAMKADPKKESIHKNEILGAYRSLALIEYKEKNYKGYSKAIEYLVKAIEYEPKKKPNEALHLFLAQMYAISIGNKEILADEARDLKNKACTEYKFVLKINPRNATAKKELGSLNCN